MKARRRIQKIAPSPGRRKRDSSGALHEARRGSRNVALLLRQTVEELLPVNANVLVLSKGDENLIRFNTCRGAHFPQDVSGRHARYYPASSSAAIAHLEALRFQGADYLVIPAKSDWWRETYAGFIRYLQRQYAVIEPTCDIGCIYFLRGKSHWLELDEIISDFKIDCDREPAILNWDGEFQIGEIFPECRWFQLSSAKRHPLPYLNKTIDFVAISRPDAARMKEARRVATAGVIVLNAGPAFGSTPSISVERLPGQRDKERPFISLVVAQSDADLPLKRKLTFLTETMPAGLPYEILVHAIHPPGRKYLWRTKQTNQPPSASAKISGPADPGKAKGDIVIFIGPQTQPLAGWLPPLLRVFKEKADAGVVGGRLINFDGTQNQIGGIAGRNGLVELLGAGEIDPASPAYGFVRELDFCATTFLATRRSVLRSVPVRPNFGKRDLAANTAFCSAVREQGWRVYFEPDSWAITFAPAPVDSATEFIQASGVASSHRRSSNYSDARPARRNGSESF